MYQSTREMSLRQIKNVARRQYWRQRRKWLALAIVAITLAYGYNRAMFGGYRICAVAWCLSNPEIAPQPTIVYISGVVQIGGSDEEE